MTGQGVNSLHAFTEMTTVDCHLFASWAINLLLNLENKTSVSLLVLPFIKSYILILSLVLLGDLIACICCLATGCYDSLPDLDELVHFIESNPYPVASNLACDVAPRAFET